MRPETPGQRARRQRTVLDPHPRLRWFEADHERVCRLRSAPDDADHAIERRVSGRPLFDSDRQRGSVDHRRRVIAGEGGPPGLVRASGVLFHLTGWRRIICDQLDPICPLDARASVPARDNEPERRAVVGRKLAAVHRQRQERAFELLTREDPARAPNRRPCGRRLVVDAGDEHTLVSATGFDAVEQREHRHALPVGDAHQAVVRRVGVAGAFDQHASAVLPQSLESRQVDCCRRLDQSTDAQRPGACRQVRRSGPDKELVGRRDQAIVRNG